MYLAGSRTCLRDLGCISLARIGQVLTQMAFTTRSEGVAYTLYYNRFSICSIMMRWLVDIRGEPQDEASRMDIGLKEINIFAEEQFAEWYLCDVNPNGQVIVLSIRRLIVTPFLS